MLVAQLRQRLDVNCKSWAHGSINPPFRVGVCVDHVTRLYFAILTLLYFTKKLGDLFFNRDVLGIRKKHRRVAKIYISILLV